MALNAYITVTAIPSIFVGTAWVFISKDWVMGLLFLSCTSIVYGIILGIDHYGHMEEIKHLYPYGKR